MRTFSPFPPSLLSQGDAYLASTGCIPHSSADTQEDALRIAQLAIALQEHCESFVAPDGSFLRMRIGLVTGPAIGGVVGATMLRYHLFGPLTSEVTCFEQAAPPGGVLVSAKFRDALFGIRSSASEAGGSGGEEAWARQLDTGSSGAPHLLRLAAVITPFPPHTASTSLTPYSPEGRRALLLSGGGSPLCLPDVEERRAVVGPHASSSLTHGVIMIDACTRISQYPEGLDRGKRICPFGRRAVGLSLSCTLNWSSASLAICGADGRSSRPPL